MSERFTAQELAMLASPAYIGSHQPWVGELDLVNVVRCRDCVYYEQDGIADSCTLFDFSMDCQYMQNGFCAWGERK